MKNRIVRRSLYPALLCLFVISMLQHIRNSDEDQKGLEYSSFGILSNMKALKIKEAKAERVQTWSVANDSLQVTLKQNGAMQVMDKVAKVKWNSVIPENFPGVVQSAKIEGKQLTTQFRMYDIDWTMTVELSDKSPEFDITLCTVNPTEVKLGGNVEYPFAFAAQNSDYRLVIPQKTGLMFTVEDAKMPKVLGRYGCYDGSGLSMPWYGMTNMKNGIIVIFETPYDVGVNVKLDDKGATYAPQVYWQPSMGTVRYPRKLHVALIKDNGYVGLSKYYRNRLIERGQYVTLREKAAIRPNIAKLIGSLDLHMRGSEESQKSMIEKFMSQGVKKMLINTGSFPKTIQWMKDQGLLVGTYKIYTDILPGGRGDEAHSRGYPQDAYTMSEGGTIRGFAFTEANKSTYRCSIMQMPLMAELEPPTIFKNGYEAYFLDVTTSLSPKECYSPAHFIDRTGDIMQRIAMLKFTAELGVVLGSEDGYDWACPYLDYFEGMVMPRRFGYMPGITVGNYKEKFTINDEYKNVDLNERVRVPLWDLVFHDSMVTSWRWNFAPDRYSEPIWWNKHDLVDIISGSMPIFLIDQDLQAQHGNRIVKTYKDCCEWFGKVGWDELIDHKALNNDRSVQESCFSSGWAVTVNFSMDKEYKMTNGSVLKPLSYKTYRWKN